MTLPAGIVALLDMAGSTIAQAQQRIVELTEQNVALQRRLAELEQGETK